MAYLSWIGDQDIKNIVSRLLAIANNSLQKSETKFNQNVIDPFSAMFQISGFNIDFDNWVISEKTRQAQKTLQNHVGEFHQNILGSISGWNNLKTGNVMDLVSHEQKILAEIKNKHNTVKGSDLSGLYSSMRDAVLPKSSIYKDFTAYYVTIIPKKPIRFNKEFTPSDKHVGERLPTNEKIRIIDGASFYELATGEVDALDNLYSCLPKVIEDASGIKLSKADTYELKKIFNTAYY